jgi:GGDEF domain-containing protein
MDCEQRDDAQIVCLSSEEATDCVRDPERGLELLREALETCVARNEHRPRSSAFIAISLDNMQSITDLFGAPVAEPVFGGLVGRLKECVRTSDVLKRVLALRSKPISTNFGAIDVKLSVASVLFPDGNLSAADIITRAQATLSFNQNRRDEPLQLTDSVRMRLKVVRSDALTA